MVLCWLGDCWLTRRRTLRRFARATELVRRLSFHGRAQWHRAPVERRRAKHAGTVSTCADVGECVGGGNAGRSVHVVASCVVCCVNAVASIYMLVYGVKG